MSTYTDIEHSVESAEPIELFRFTYGTTRFLYTSADHDISYLSETYVAVPIKRGNITHTQDLGVAELEVMVSRDNDLASVFIGPPPDAVVNLTIFRSHVDISDVVVVFKGRVISVAFGKSEAKLTCEPVFTSLSRPGLRAIYQMTCRHLVYGFRCGANSSAFRVSGTVNTINGIAITSPIFATKADGWFTGGWIEFTNGVKRMIISHVGNTIKMATFGHGIGAGASFYAYAGCDKAMNTCINKFGNFARYGGFPYMPKKNPFEGDAII